MSNAKTMASSVTSQLSRRRGRETVGSGAGGDGLVRTVVLITRFRPGTRYSSRAERCASWLLDLGERRGMLDRLGLSLLGRHPSHHQPDLVRRGAGTEYADDL